MTKLATDSRFRTVMVTGGAGFIGSAVVRRLVGETETKVVNVDKLTYAGNTASLTSVASSSRYAFERVDIGDVLEVRRVLEQHRPDAIMHLAAESHLDRSIDGPDVFLQTNVMGTYVLLQEARRYWERLEGAKRDRFRFHHVSTDEVYGSLGAAGCFTEATAYRPNSPYSASKAAADHLARSWHHTFSLPVVISNCSNNYGPYQYPEKLIPLTILNAAEGRPLPVYGTGENVRDWLYVDDHVGALWRVLTAGRTGECYLIGGRSEKTNIEVVRRVCEILDELEPSSPRSPRDRLIHHVTDRPGHDWRYAIDPGKVERELGWRPQESFETGLKKTVQWYLATGEWCRGVQEASRHRRGLGGDVEP